MSKLKVPSLQHLARNWHSSPERIARRLVALVRNSPTFSYELLFVAVRDMLLFGLSYDGIVEGIRRGIKRTDVRDNFLGVLPLIRDHFEGVSPSFVQAVDRRFYPIGRGLLIPFDPPLIYGASGQLHFPWFSFWRSNPLEGEALSLFVTMAEEMLLQDPDLESADFKILDFSAPAPGEGRELEVINAADIPRVTAARKSEMLEVFVEGFTLAKAALAEAEKAKPKEPPRDEMDKNKDGHPDLFGDR